MYPAHAEQSFNLFVLAVRNKYHILIKTARAEKHIKQWTARLPLEISTYFRIKPISISFQLPDGVFAGPNHGNSARALIRISSCLLFHLVILPPKEALPCAVQLGVSSVGEHAACALCVSVLSPLLVASASSSPCALCLTSPSDPLPPTVAAADCCVCPLQSTCLCSGETKTLEIIKQSSLWKSYYNMDFIYYKFIYSSATCRCTR